MGRRLQLFIMSAPKVLFAALLAVFAVACGPSPDGPATDAKAPDAPTTTDALQEVFCCVVPTEAGHVPNTPDVCNATSNWGCNPTAGGVVTACGECKTVGEACLVQGFQSGTVQSGATACGL